MAEFCAQCAKELGFDGDFVGLTREEDWEKGMGVLVICEGCGPIQVTPDGYCIGGCANPSHEPIKPLHTK